MQQHALLHLGTATVVLAGLFAGLLFTSSAMAAEKEHRTDNRTENLAYLPATEQIKRFKAGTLSPVDVLKAQIEQIKKHNGPLNTTGKELHDYLAFNGQVNAITYEHFDKAMAAAKVSEKRYKESTARPLEGITVSVKDE